VSFFQTEARGVGADMAALRSTQPLGSPLPISGISADPAE